MGRTKALSRADQLKAYNRIVAGESYRQIAPDFKVSPQTLYRLMQDPPEAPPNGDPPKITPSTPPREAASGIPINPQVKGDLIRAAYLMITGSGHRGTIQSCLDDLTEFLQRAEVAQRGGKSN